MSAVKKFTATIDQSENFKEKSGRESVLFCAYWLTSFPLALGVFTPILADFSRNFAQRIGQNFGWLRAR